MNTKTMWGLLTGLLAFVLVGCIYRGDANRTTGRVIDDRSITGKVKGSLDDSPVYKFPNVKVTTYNGVVQLSGFVIRDEQKAEASELARRVAGVTEVINNISLAPAGYPGGTEPAGRARNTRTTVPPGS